MSWPLPLLLALSLGTAAPDHPPATTIAPDSNRAVIYLFWGDGCPHCAAEKRYLDDLVRRRPGVVVRQYEVWRDAANQDLLQRFAAAWGFEPRAVPTTFLADRYWVGFGDMMRFEIEALVDRCLLSGCPDAGSRVPGFAAPPAPTLGIPAPTPPAPAATPAPSAAPAAPGTTPAASPRPPSAAPADTAADGRAAGPASPPGGPASASSIRLPFVGYVQLAGRSLLVTTALIAFVDGFNPCSMWVLSVLLALTLQTRSRRHVLIVGLVFLTVTSVVYAAFIAGLFTVFRVVAFLGWIQVLVALVALTFGLINVKDYFWWGVGPSLTIAAEDKPGLYQAMRRVRTATGSLPGLVAATVALSAGVSVVEFGCTAGFPVLWTNLLNQQQTGAAVFLVLLLLYMLIYQLDELAVFLVAVLTLRASRFEERHGRALKLLGGMLMLALAGVMLVRPALMNDVGSALVVFGAAFLATFVIILVHRRRQPAASRA